MNKIQKYFLDKKAKNIQKQTEKQSQYYMSKEAVMKSKIKQAEIQNTAKEMIDTRSMF